MTCNKLQSCLVGGCMPVWFASTVVLDPNMISGMRVRTKCCRKMFPPYVHHTANMSLPLALNQTVIQFDHVWRPIRVNYMYITVSWKYYTIACPQTMTYLWAWQKTLIKYQSQQGHFLDNLVTK